MTSAPCSLSFKIPAQLGSSFFSFVNYLPWLLGESPCLLGLPGCSGLAVLLPGPLPAQPSPSCRPLLPPPRGEATKAQESWQAWVGSGRRVALRKRLQM